MVKINSVASNEIPNGESKPATPSRKRATRSRARTPKKVVKPTDADGGSGSDGSPDGLQLTYSPADEVNAVIAEVSAPAKAEVATPLSESEKSRIRNTERARKLDALCSNIYPIHTGGELSL